MRKERKTRRHAQRKKKDRRQRRVIGGHGKSKDTRRSQRCVGRAAASALAALGVNRERSIQSWESQRFKAGSQERPPSSLRVERGDRAAPRMGNEGRGRDRRAASASCKRMRSGGERPKSSTA
eukprot:scaffold15880_cov158-Cylindrotheca_fusiformis.AAC.2